MAGFVPISKSRHAGSGWARPNDYRFTADTEMVPLLAEEIGKVMLAMPLAFRRQQAASGQVGYQLVALLSPLVGRNLFVKPDGSWLCDHVPLHFRTYPFRLMTSAGSGEQLVCFDEGSGLLAAAGAPGITRFFDETGEPGDAFKEIMVSLRQYEHRRSFTQKAVDMLAELQLIVPWPLVVRDDAGRQAPGVSQVFKVDGAALSKLTAEALFKLHQCGALPIAYAQLLSEQRVQHFGTLLQAQDSHKQPQANLDAFFATQSDVIRFGKM